jgi:hypothetical protein
LHNSYHWRKLEKDNDWHDGKFDDVDWSAYHLALQKNSRSHIISIAKMSHQLWNNNAQNEKDYGHSNLCPVCKTEKDLVIM